LPPLIIPLERIDRLERDLPELPAARRERFRAEYPALTPYDIDVLTASPGIGSYFEHVARPSGDPKAAANWTMGDVMATLKATGGAIEHFTIRPADLADLLVLIHDGVVSHTAAKQIFGIMVKTGDRPSQIASRENLLRVSDDSALVTWIDEVFAEHPGEARRFAGGERRLQGVLVGHVMKKSKGSADPKRVNQLLAERIGT
jgi:aspartyl-tRNA(Asn)/glutamyl-tRNA(Gln) amidotransferase subunit B